MKKILAALAALLFLAGDVGAVSGRRFATLAHTYDLTSTAALVYPVFIGRNGEPLGEFLNPQTARVATSGSSTTVAAVTSGTEPFANVAVGDLLIFQLRGQNLERKVTARADADSITVDTAIDLTVAASGPFQNGYGFLYKTFADEVDATATWIPVHGFDAGFQINVQVVTFNATGILANVECRQEGGGAGTTIVATKTFAAVGTWDVFVELPFHECRLGLQLDTDGGAQSISAQFMGLYDQN